MTQFCDSLLALTSREHLVLFAGAGVGVHAGLMDWSAFISHLIRVAAKYEPETAALMKVRAQAGLLAEAARYYKLSCMIPEGEKFAQLAAPFQDGKFNPRKLDMLVKLPFEAIVTTNYDRSMDHSWAYIHRKVPNTYELDDGSLTQAVFASDFYIARIHGRARKPESMVVSTDDFSQLDNNPTYRDFLAQNILTRHSCLFVGFSFLDPAINKILEFLEKYVGPSYPKRHYAVIEAGANALAAKLAKFNIQVFSYADHKDLWSCIESLPLKLVDAGRPSAARETYPVPFAQMRFFLASCYVQSRMSKAAAPVRDVALRGITLSILEREGRNARVSRLSDLLRQVIPMTTDEANLVTSRALDSLAQSGWVEIVDPNARIIKDSPKVLEENIEVLVKGALSRLYVREGVDPKPFYGDSVRSVLEEIFLTRGWDLGAEFAGARNVGTTDLYSSVRSFFRRTLPTESFERHDRLAGATYDLLKRPDELEARILAELARLSFGLNVMLKTGNSALKLEALPEQIYLDASILMPAITDGHPFRPVYQSTIERISQSAAEMGKACELLVITHFLNEIVSHRNLGIEMVKDLGLEDPERLEKHVLYYGAENTNVFVGSYASWVGRQKKSISFDAFLNEAAPYGTESDLARFLERFGIRTVKLQESDQHFRNAFGGFLHVLRGGYREFGDIGWVRDKADILIEHEAKQLAQLELELKTGRHCYFVTADKALREIVGLIRPGSVWNVVISHLGLVQLADLLLGVDADPRSLARLLWGIMDIDEHTALRDYFIDLALRRHDEALAMTIPQIIEEFVGDAEKAAKLERVKFFTRAVEDKAKAARFLDRFEKQFFEKMEEALRRRKAQQ